MVLNCGQLLFIVWSREVTHICTAVKDDWQRSGGMNAGTKGGEHEFGDGDQNASNACSHHEWVP